MVRVGRLVLFLEVEPDFLLSPDTYLGDVRREAVETVLVDPGMPTRDVYVAGRFRKLERLLSELDLFPNVRRVFIVSPDVWDAKTNIKLFERTRSLVKSLRLRVDYDLVLYVHGYFTNPEAYKPHLSEAIVGVPTAVNTLHLPYTVRCSAGMSMCEKDIALLLGQFDRVHLGGAGLRVLKTVSRLLNTQTLLPSASPTWLSADTHKFHYHYGKSTMPMLTKNPAMRETLHREYLLAFLEKVMRLKF